MSAQSEDKPEQICVDVVVDVPSADVDRAFTYRTNGFRPSLGTRVRVPFGGRVVSGWVISAPAALPTGTGTGALKPIESVESEAAQFGPEAVHLAAWLRRRYACSFREALAAVAPRLFAGGERSVYAFVQVPAPADRLAHVLHRSFNGRSFSALAAMRVMTRARLRTSAVTLRNELARLERRGIVRRSASTSSRAPRATPRAQFAVLVNSAAAKGSVQRRLAVALADHDGRMPVAQARHLAGASAQCVCRAVRAGVIAIETEAPPGPAHRFFR